MSSLVTPRYPVIVTLLPRTWNQLELPVKISCHENTGFPAASIEMSTIRQCHKQQVNNTIIEQVGINAKLSKRMLSPTKVATPLLTRLFDFNYIIHFYTCNV